MVLSGACGSTAVPKNCGNTPDVNVANIMTILRSGTPGPLTYFVNYHHFVTKAEVHLGLIDENAIWHVSWNGVIGCAVSETD